MGFFKSDKRPDDLKKMTREDYAPIVRQKASSMSDSAILQKLGLFKTGTQGGRIVVDGALIFRKPWGAEADPTTEYTADEVLELWIDSAKLSELNDF